MPFPDSRGAKNHCNAAIMAATLRDRRGRASVAAGCGREASAGRPSADALEIVEQTNLASSLVTSFPPVVDGDMIAKFSRLLSQDRGLCGRLVALADAESSRSLEEDRSCDEQRRAQR